MPRLKRLIALGVLAAVSASPLRAQITAGPPDWQDGGTSVYLPAAAKIQPAASTPIGSAQVTTRRKLDSQVVPSAHEEATPVAEASGRRLAPPGIRQGNDKLADQNSRANNGAHRLID